ncbi:MAG TPA: ATP synthase subunit I [Pyrinomonadaceae bacterium]|nr:ATP synthase subunit I [Pyrinomonadaceae bacterium]
MNETTNNEGAELFSASGGDATNRRIFRSMIVVVILAVGASLLFAPWRFSTGLLLGGLLSLLNHYWLTTSTTAAFSVLIDGQKPRLSLVQYVLRYAVIGSVIVLAYKFRIASVPALIAGLCSFVFALFVEAFREFYFAIIHREEII